MPILTDFLTGIANAIRNKKGTTDKINAQNFASEIEGIETGGGSVKAGVTYTKGEPMVILSAITNLRTPNASVTREE